MRSVRWSRWLFLVAGIYGVLAVAPLYFGGTAGRGLDLLYRYGFAGAAGATELMYLVIATDPRRYRALMPVGLFSKLSAAIPCELLAAVGRVAPVMAWVGLVDLLLGAGFLASWIALRRDDEKSGTRSVRAD
jgi:hypothetical protein